MRKFFDELNEATVLTGGQISGDDDFPPGTTVFGNKFVPVVVKNRLTGATLKYVPAEDLGLEWNYDEFEDSMSMGSYKSYSDTLDGLSDLLGDRVWKHTDNRKFRMQQDKWIHRSGDQGGGGVKQVAKLGDDKDDYVHKAIPKAHKDTENMDITEKINQYVGEVEQIEESVVDSSDRKSLAQAIMQGKNAKINIKSLGTQAVVTNYDNEIIITYPKSEDFTLTLVDIADTLGMTFKLTKDGGKQAFRMMK